MTKARNNELTAVANRDVFDDYPAGCTSEQDQQRWRQFRERYHDAQQLRTRYDFPLQIDFELNSTCQMKCAFCVHGQEIVKKRELGFDVFKRAIDEGAKHGLCSIKLNYINEPLLNRDLPAYIEYARSRGVLNTYFASNGILLTEATARKLIDVKLSKIMVSLDAATSKTFSLMRRSTKFDEIIANIERFVELRKELGVDYPKLRVNFLRTTTNATEADEFVSRWEGVADAIGFQTQIALPGVDDDLFRGDEVVLQDFRCSFPFKQLVVDSGGQILPCCTFNGREMPLGNLATSTLQEAWDSQRMVELQELQQAGRWDENPICKHCISGY